MFTYLQILNLIKDTAKAQPNVNSVVREFLDLNREDALYSAVVIQDRDGERDRIYEQDWVTYTWHLGYVDRLTYDESNRDDIYSTGINIINNIVNSIRNAYFPVLDVSVIDRFTTFNQRFTAQCAGVYVVLAVQMAAGDCEDGADDMYDTLEKRITRNGEYRFVPDGRPWDEVKLTVNVSAEVDSEELYDVIGSNGRQVYEPEEGIYYDRVVIDTDVHPTQRFVRTYTTNGQKTAQGEWKDATININVPVPEEDEIVIDLYYNGSLDWYPDDGKLFSKVVTNVDIHPEDSLIRTYTSNGVYQLEGEWKDGQITVDVPTQTPPVSYESVTYTENGVYSVDPPAGGLLGGVEVTVDVPPPIATAGFAATLDENKRYEFYPPEGYSYIMLDLLVDVHPSTGLIRTYTTNGVYQLESDGEWRGGQITVDVPPQKPEEVLSRRIYDSGSYTFYPSTGSVFSSARIDVGIPKPANDEIYYVTYSGTTTSPTHRVQQAGNRLLSNTLHSSGKYCILKFENDVTEVGYQAFFEKLELREIYLPDSVTKLSGQCFAYSGLQRCVMQNTVTLIDGYAFEGCYTLVSPFRISTGCTSLAEGAFSGCTALGTITIPAVTSGIGDFAFKDSVNLINVIVHPVNPPVLAATDGVYGQFEGCSPRLRIRVPEDSLQDYLTAPGWREYAQYIIPDSGA